MVTISNRTTQEHLSNNGTLVEPFVELFEVPVAVVALLSVCYGAVSLVSVAGNAAVLWVVVARRRMRTVTNYFIGNLALADIVIGLFAVPFQFQAALLQRWLLPHFLCSFCPFVQVLSVNVSVFTLTAIAFDRYRAVLHPQKGAGATKKGAKAIILCIWLLGALGALPYALTRKVIHTYDPRTGAHDKPLCTNMFASKKLWAAYDYSLVGIQYALPLVLISYAYGRMGSRLRGSALTATTRPGDVAVLKNKKKPLYYQNVRSGHSSNKRALIVPALSHWSGLPGHLVPPGYALAVGIPSRVNPIFTNHFAIT
ncbi:hypothetical protein JTE90_001671 [Oedothorax gibbosus]|uniref:G-protein coupled receptors family 1 profile domain-containing protein n=1 Tax=Oedothorax gibbosus TaxID=931172 RepID=A0AAV6UHW7_9ARAC|nr:hypothetical protein JTE90_001671 [Oedothorax gibbosus]